MAQKEIVNAKQWLDRKYWSIAQRYLTELEYADIKPQYEQMTGKKTKSQWQVLQSYRVLFAEVLGMCKEQGINPRKNLAEEMLVSGLVEPDDDSTGGFFGQYFGQY